LWYIYSRAVKDNFTLYRNVSYSRAIKDNFTLYRNISYFRAVEDNFTLYRNISYNATQGYYIVESAKGLAYLYCRNSTYLGVGDKIMVIDPNLRPGDSLDGDLIRGGKKPRYAFWMCEELPEPCVRIYMKCKVGSGCNAGSHIIKEEHIGEQT